MAVRTWLSTLKGIKVLNESRARFESAGPNKSIRAANRTDARHAMHTLLSDLEEFIRVPAHNTSLESAPAPFDHARNDLWPSLAFLARVTASFPYHWLRHSEFVGQCRSTEGWRAISAIEEVPYKGSDGAGVGGRAEGEEQEWKIESCMADVSNAAWLLKTHEGSQGCS